MKILISIEEYEKYTKSHRTMIKVLEACQKYLDCGRCDRGMLMVQIDEALRLAKE
jgi:hypothetical protein